MLRETTHNAWTTKQRMEHFKKQTETTKDGPFYEASFVSCFCIIKWYILCLFVVLHKMVHPLLFVWAYWMVRPLLFRMAPQPVPYFVVWFCYPNHYTKCFIRSDAKRDSQVWSIFWSTTRKQRMDHCMKQTLAWWFCYMTWYILCGLLQTMLRSYCAFWLCFGKYSIQMYVTMYVTFYGATRSSNGCSNI